MSKVSYRFHIIQNTSIDTASYSHLQHLTSSTASYRIYPIFPLLPHLSYLTTSTASCHVYACLQLPHLKHITLGILPTTRHLSTSKASYRTTSKALYPPHQGISLICDPTHHIKGVLPHLRHPTASTPSYRYRIKDILPHVPHFAT